MSSRLPRALLALLAIASASVPGLLAQDAPLKIAVVDVERVLTETQAGSERLAALDSFAGRERARLERMQEELNRLRERVAAAEDSLAERELGRLRQELERKNIVFNQAAEDVRREIQQRRQTVFEEMEGIVTPVIEAIGDEGKYTLIFRNLESGLIYVARHVDVTDEVIARINAGAASSGAGESP